jgi:hypothetical protein
MNSLPLVLAPLALLLVPVLHHGAGDRAGEVLEDARQSPMAQQVRIEQHVVIRIAPGPVDIGQRLMNDLSRAQRPKRFKEKKLDGCVPISAIAAVRPYTDNRLLLYLRDRRVISAALEKSCRAEEFYQGAYVARGEDGQLCPKRDRLHSRTGGNCQVAKLSRLVPRD